MKTRSFGKKCKCGHHESEHVNENKKFYEPNRSPEMDYFMSPPPIIENPKQIKCKVCSCETFSSEKKGFWK